MVELVRNNSLPAGFRVHWYEIDSILGEGGFGITYLAQDTNLDQKVAVKEFFPRELASRSPEGTVHTLRTGSNELYDWGLSRFLFEARTLAKFKHPNIVFVYSVFEQNQTAYMVMEHLRGGNLAKPFKQGTFDAEEKLMRILFPLLDGIKAIHDAGFIHRDIKPSNILLRENGDPVLLDFGSARQALGAKTRMLTSLVSPGFTPFEQYSDGSDTEKQGPWTDLYSLGATLYMALFGQRPVDALKRTSAILAGTSDPMLSAARAGNGKYSPQFLNAIDKALSFYPEKRPQSVEAFIELLPVRSIKELNRTLIAKRPKTPTLEITPAQSTSTKKPPALSIQNRWLVGLSAVITLTVAAYGLLKDTPTSPATPSYLEHPENINIDRLLDDARQDLIASRLIAPPGNNAVERFKAVLKIESDNEEAKSGLENIVARYVRLAERALSRNQFGTARQYLDQASEIVPDNGKITIARTKLDTKWQNSNTLDKINGLLERADRNLAYLRLSSPPGDNALENFRAILELDSSNADAIEGLEQIIDRYVRLAENATAREQFEKASEFLEKAKEIQPGAENITKANAMLTEAKSTEKRRQEVRRLLTAADKEFVKLRLSKPSGRNALALFNEVLKLEPGNSEAKTGLKRIVDRYVEFAERAITRERFIESKKFLNKAHAIQPTAEKVKALDTQLAEAVSTKQKREKIRGLLTEAKKDLAASRLTEPPGDNALERYKSLLKIDPDNNAAKQGLIRIAERLVQLAEQSLRKEQFIDANELLRQAESIRPNALNIRSTYSKLEDAKRTTETRHEIERLLADASNDLKASRLTSPRGVNALERFNAVLGLDQNNGEANRGLQTIVDRYIALASQQISKGDLNVAEEYLNTANDILPDDKTVDNSLDLLANEKLTRKNSEAVNSLLANANLDITAGRLSAPVGNNAIERFSAVLKIDKENTEAKKGIEGIFDRYARLAKKAFTNEQMDKADAYLDKADTVLTSNADTLSRSKKTLIAELRTTVAKQRQTNRDTSNRRIAELLASANQDIADFRYSSPIGNNATERFQSVFEIEPNNTQAIQGLKKIVERYLYLADRETVKRNFERAEQYIAKGTTVLPHLRAFSDTYEKLDQTQADAKKRLAEEKNWAQIQEQEALARDMQDRVKRLLESAEQDLIALRLVGPSEPNAYDRYKEILALEPDNEEAVLGLNKIVDHHIKLADEAASRKQFEEAKNFLMTAESIKPGAQRLSDAQVRLRAAIENAKQATAAKLTPTLSEPDILGEWCNDSFSLTLNHNQLTFRLSNGNITPYPVQRYAFNDNTVLVYWKNQQDVSMITELGNFETGPDKVPMMTQVRGKADGTEVWHAYNRLFRRCANK